MVIFYNRTKTNQDKRKRISIDDLLQYIDVLSRNDLYEHVMRAKLLKNDSIPIICITVMRRAGGGDTPP